MANSEQFYSTLKYIEDIKLISSSSSYEPLPCDWCIIATDIQNSTQAIQNGKYKEVNMVGALTIVAILNINKTLDIPFVFGGDGAFILIPPSILQESKQSLLAVQKIAKESYNLTLRVGVIPASTLKEKKILITKLQISLEYSQAIIKGGGLEYCDALLKQDSSYHISDLIDPYFKVNIEGLECRWRDIPSPKDETLSILIKAKEEQHYQNILNSLENILGDSSSRHPISEDNMHLSFSNFHLDTEASLHNNNSFLKALYITKFKLINFLGTLLMRYKIGQWGMYKKKIIATTDTEKFDDILRMVVSTNFQQTQLLEEYLQQQYKKGMLLYGIHKTKSSLMTCLIFERHGKHIHFVDASNGGYAQASKMLKKQFNKS